MKTTLNEGNESGSFFIDDNTNVDVFLEMRRNFLKYEKLGKDWSFSVSPNVSGDTIQFAITRSKKRMDAFLWSFYEEIAAETEIGHLTNGQMSDLYQLGRRRGRWDILLSLALRTDLPDELIGKFLNTRDDEIKRHFLLRNYTLHGTAVKKAFIKYFAKNYETLFLNQLLPLLNDDNITIRSESFELWLKLLPKFSNKMSNELRVAQHKGLSHKISLKNCRSVDLPLRTAIKKAVRLCKATLFMSRPVQIKVKDIISPDCHLNKHIDSILPEILIVALKSEGLLFPETKIKYFARKINETVSV
ncbi:MAG: hypothetical protein IJU44_13210 [Kiritimatiellae bacterium]|nr:hypothetical protein [Kiritimatiellia bacterium]